MITTKIKYSPSVNIIRDSELSLNYITTPNSNQIFNQIIDNFDLGIHCFSLVGAYGSGKSSFLWAFEKTLNREKSFFSNKKIDFLKLKSFYSIRIIGSYNSFLKSFAEKLGCKDCPNDILERLNMLSMEKSKKHIGILILVDEFGKFLEYAAKENPSEEIYFVQQLAEFINNPSNNILFITTLHQDFKSYSFGLNKSQVNEWDKVKGRLKEVTFNEPVEQLLFLLAERISELNLKVEKNRDLKKLLEIIKKSKSFLLKDFLNIEISEKIFPFDILSASVLTLALQKYGQNDRSVFSFLELNEPFGFKDFLYKYNYKKFFNIANICDYLFYNYNSFVFSKFNPHLIQWLSIKNSIEKVEGRFNKDVESALKIIKLIGLLNIFTSSSSRIDRSFLIEYSKLSLGITDPEEIIDRLESHKLIRFSRHRNKYILFEWTDLDIDLAINEAGKLVEEISEIVPVLKEYFRDEYILAKSVFYRYGTPRIFKYTISEEPLLEIPEQEIDGFINLVFPNKKTLGEIQEISKNSSEAILFGVYTNISDIKNLLYLIERIKKVKNEHSEDQVAIKELNIILNHQKNLLNHYLFRNIFSDTPNVIWFYKGEKINISDKKQFNKELSRICEDVYNKIPLYQNELINRTKISGAIASAKRIFLNLIINNFNEDDLGFDKDKFPPEKTIYLSLLKNTGIHVSGSFQEPKENSFKELWNVCDNFIKSSTHSRKNLKDLIDILLQKPFKLKSGFIDFWIPVFLFIKREEFALYSESGFIPSFNEEVFELMNKNPHKFDIKAFDISGLKLEMFNQYRTILNKSTDREISNSGFIDTVKPFLIFYKNLPEFSKKTKNISKKAVLVREVISNSKDPEKIFFEEFPTALNFDPVIGKTKKQDIENYLSELQLCINEITVSFNELVLRLENFVSETLFGHKYQFEELKVKIKKRYNSINEILLTQDQRSFYHRLVSEIDDKKSWINSVSSLIIKKPLESITDDEEIILYEKLKDSFQELDNWCEISKLQVDVTIEEVIMYDITSLNESLSHNILRYPKSKEKLIINLKEKISKILTKDKNTNKAALIKLLKEQL